VVPEKEDSSDPRLGPYWQDCLRVCEVISQVDTPARGRSIENPKHV